eukprot:6068983-Pyramimonas_sp.AAC.1
MVGRGGGGGGRGGGEEVFSKQRFDGAFEKKGGHGGAPQGRRETLDRPVWEPFRPRRPHDLCWS